MARIGSGGGSPSTTSSSSEIVGSEKVKSGDRAKKPATGQEPKKNADLKDVHKKSKADAGNDPVVDVAGTLASGTNAKARRKEARAEKREKAQAEQPAPQRNPNKEKVVNNADSSSESASVSLNSKSSSSSSSKVSKEDSDDETGNDQQSQLAVGDKPVGEAKPPLETTKKLGPSAPYYDPTPGLGPLNPDDDMAAGAALLPAQQSVRSAHSFASDKTLVLAGRYLKELADLKADHPAGSIARGARSFAVGTVGYLPFFAGSAVGTFGKEALGEAAGPLAWALMGSLDVMQGEIWLPLIRKESVGSESTGAFHADVKTMAGQANTPLSGSELVSKWWTMKKTDDFPFLMMPLSNAIPEAFASPDYFKNNPGAEFAIKQLGFAFLLSGLAVKTLDDLRIGADPKSFAPEKPKEILELQKAALKSFASDLDLQLGKMLGDGADHAYKPPLDRNSAEGKQFFILRTTRDTVELQLKATELALKGKSAVIGHKLKTMFTPGHIDGLRKTSMMVISRIFSLAAGSSFGLLSGMALKEAGAGSFAVAAVPPFIGQLFGYCLRQEYNACLNAFSYYCSSITKGFPESPINPYDFNSPHLRQADPLQGMPPPRTTLDARASGVAQPSSQIASTPTTTTTTAPTTPMPRPAPRPTQEIPTHMLPLEESQSSDGDEA